MSKYDIEIKKINLSLTDSHLCNFILSEKFEPKNSNLGIIFKNLLLNYEEKLAFYMVVCALHSINVSFHFLNHDCPKTIYKNSKELLKKEKLDYVKIYRLCTNDELIKIIEFMFNQSLTSINCEIFFKIYSDSKIPFDKTFWTKIHIFIKENFDIDVQDCLEFDNKPNCKRNRSSNPQKPKDFVCDISNQSFYKIDENRDNLCLIFNDDQRKGSEVDVNSIKSTFEAIKGFNIKVEKITSREKFNNDLRKYTNQISLDSDMIIIFIMSHGEGGLIRCPNDDSIIINDIIKFFTVKNVQKLANKPKIFIFQACRGNDYQEVVQFDAPIDEVTKPQINKTSIQDGTLNLSDLFIVHSTLFGQKSLRDTIEGSCFIQAFCEIVSKCSKSLSIDEMCTVINRKYPIFKSDGKTISQQCEVTKSLLKFHIFLESPTERKRLFNNSDFGDFI